MPKNIGGTKSIENNALLRIYDSVGNPSGWHEALDALVEVSGCRSAMLSVGDIAPFANGVVNNYELTAISSVLRSDSTAAEEYFEKFGEQDAAAFAFMRDVPKQQIVDDTFVWPDIESVKENEDFRFRRDRFGMYRRFAVRLNDNQRWVEAATFHIGAEHAVIPAPVRENVAVFVPHMAKAIELGRTFVELRRRYNAMLSVLDKVKIGLGIVSNDGTLLVINEEANRILEQASGIHRSSEGKLKFNDENIEIRLSRAIIGATRTAAGVHDITEFKTYVKEHDKGAATDSGIFLEIAPIRDTFDELGTRGDYALLTLIDPNETRNVSIERLSLAYMLSASESDVCRLLIEGQTQAEIAEIRGVGYETVKSQSQVILRKTGARSRLELIRLALRTSPPIEP